MKEDQGDDPYDLKRFVTAQAGVYPQVCLELKAGRKRSHWMWFIFPQIRGLGSSPTAVRYAISAKEEARAYLQHPLLGPRLRECTRLTLEHEGTTVEAIFGYPDHLKFHSCMTLFALVPQGGVIFVEALDRWFGGEQDRGTLTQLI